MTTDGPVLAPDTNGQNNNDNESRLVIVICQSSARQYLSVLAALTEDSIFLGVPVCVPYGGLVWIQPRAGISTARRRRSKWASTHLMNVRMTGITQQDEIG